MQTVRASRPYLRGFIVGLVAGLPLAAAFASLFGGRSFRLSGLMAGIPPTGADTDHAIAGALVGLAIGVGIGIASAALSIAAASAETRQHLHEPEPTVEDTGLGRTFPGVFGTADPFEPFKRRIDAEEGKEPLPAPPATMPEKCPACGKALESEEPIAFCYHCGGALA